MGVYRDFHRRSLAERESFWAEEARLVHWQRPFDQVLDYSRPPFARWFVGGRTNLCHNAIDRHLAARADQEALVWISTEVNETRSYTYRQLFAEVNRVAAMMQDLGVKQGDRVIVYMPMIPEAAFAMLACARLGAIHSVVFGGFAAASLATRIDDAKPNVMITADAGMRGGKAVPYKHLVDEACRLARHPPRHVVIVNRGIDDTMPRTAGRDLDYATLQPRSCGCIWDTIGFGEQLHTIRSYEKLTSEGMHFIGADLIQLVDDILPSRFGGDATDYQFVEEERGLLREGRLSPARPRGPARHRAGRIRLLRDQLQGCDAGAVPAHAGRRCRDGGSRASRADGARTAPRLPRASGDA